MVQRDDRSVLNTERQNDVKSRVKMKEEKEIGQGDCYDYLETVEPPLLR